MSENSKNEKDINNQNINISINNESLFSSTIASQNPMVIQLIEFGYDEIYSRRVFHYLHPEDLEEALNYMSIEKGIIQHHFVHNNRNINNINDKLCYICGEKKSIHLNELNINESIDKELSNNNINNINNVNSKNNSRNTNSNYEIKSNSSSSFSCKNVDEKINEEKINNKMRQMKKNNNIKSKGKNIECEICGDEFIVNNKNKVEKCGHDFCDGCWFDFLSVKINENRLPSIKCLNYNCQEKLTDEFIINLLNNDEMLIKKYKRYKLELEIIKDPNKKLCPYPNCNSYLELKEIRNKDVTCINKHTYCFNCLKKPHGKLPCDKNIDKDIVEYAKNNFVKKCPNCSIITEKNSGCNHITCSKCGYQWCWLCNEKYTKNHFYIGKCRGFQFFKPKNDYEIKLVMEGKINVNELSNSQRQFEDDFVLDILDRIDVNDDIELELEFRSLNLFQKILFMVIYIFYGHVSLIFGIQEYNYRNIINRSAHLIINTITILPMTLFNLIMFIPLVFIYGIRRIIIPLILEDYAKQLILFFGNILIGQLSLCYGEWRKMLRNHLLRKYSMRFLYSMYGIVFISSLLMSIIVIFPQRILINIFYIIFCFFIDKSLLDDNFEFAFNIRFLR